MKLDSTKLTNVLLIVLIVLAGYGFISFQEELSALHKNSNFIGNDVKDISSGLSQIQQETKYIQISTDEISAHFGGY